MSKVVRISEEKLVDVIHNIVEATMKENKIPKAPQKVQSVAKKKKVVKITEANLAKLVGKIVKKTIEENKK